MRRWAEEEIIILKNDYKNKSKDDLLFSLKNRTWLSIQIKAFKLKLTRPTLEQRFWFYVDKKQKNDCWHWTGSCNNKGYGRIQINKKNIAAHRLSWKIHFGMIPKDLCVLHTCDNPKCVNPNHLFLGTSEDNIKDKVDKNRQAKGENIGISKLTMNQVKEIRILKGKFSQRKIAKMFSVAYSTIAYIHKNKTWRHIK